MLTEKRPDLIIITGGTDKGASKSLLSIMESIGLSSYLLEESQRPHILYTGNEELQEEVKSGLEKISKLFLMNLAIHITKLPISLNITLKKQLK